jgi:hypothetical protein
MVTALTDKQKLLSVRLLICVLDFAMSDFGGRAIQGYPRIVRH